MEVKDFTEKQISRKTMFEGKIMNVYVDEVSLPNGKTGIREVVDHVDGVGVLAIDDEDRVLTVTQYRYVFGKNLLEIPAGKLDRADEDPLDCAVRELEEETGLQAETMTLLTSVLTTPGFCTEKIGIYLAQGLSQGSTHPDEDEFLDLVRMPLDEAVELVMRGDIRDGKTICGLLMAREALLRQRAQA